MAVNLSKRLIIGAAASGIIGIFAVIFLPGLRPFEAQAARSCRAKLVTIFNTPALLNALPTPVRVVYVFDVRHADRREVKHILMSAIGSRESFSFFVSPDQHLVTYMTGRIGDLAGASNEIYAMCTRESDDGFRLRTVRIIGDGVDVRIGPDKATEPNGPGGSIENN
jgi:hypothetical protein